MPTPETTDDARREARANVVARAVRIAAITTLLCLLYVLSLGPVVGILTWAGPPTSGPAAAHAIGSFYAPVLYVHDHTPLKELLEKYVNWWEEQGRRLH